MIQTSSESCRLRRCCLSPHRRIGVLFGDASASSAIGFLARRRSISADLTDEPTDFEFDRFNELGDNFEPNTDIIADDISTARTATT